MGLIDTLGRIPKILEANVNALLDKCENPEKMINQMLVDYKRNLADVKQNTSEVNADLAQAKARRDAQQAEVDKAKRAAENALKAGNDGDARQIIESMQKKEELLASMEEQVRICQENSDQLTSAYNKLVSDITILEQRAQVAKSKITQAKAQEKVSGAINKAGKMAGVEETLAKYEAKADRAYEVAKAKQQLEEGTGTDEDMINKYASGETTVDARMAEMKKQLGLN